MFVITLARKPAGPTTVVSAVSEWGTSALAIDPTRVGSGRWPANMILSSKAAVEDLDAQSGEIPTQRTRSKHSPSEVGAREGGLFGRRSGIHHQSYLGEVGGASRFFKQVQATPRAKMGRSDPEGGHPWFAEE